METPPLPTSGKDSPFALIPDDVFRDIQEIHKASKSLLNWLMLAILFPVFHLVLFVRGLMLLRRIFKLKLDHPILFGLKNIYVGRKISEIKVIARDDHRLRLILLLRSATIRIILVTCVSVPLASSMILVWVFFS